MQNLLLVAAGIAFLLVVGPLVYWWVGLRPLGFTLAQGLLLLLTRFLCRVQWRSQGEGSVDIPVGQPAILICNHRSSVDPFFVQTYCRRPIYWMVAKEYCQHSAFAWFLKTCQVIPVNRSGNDTAAIKMTLRHLRQGALVGMFPEGRINFTDQLMQPIRPGAILIAIKAKVPVIPCYVEGSPYRKTPWSPFLMRARVRVKIGDPIDVNKIQQQYSGDEALREVTYRCVKAIAELAGQPDFEPQNAGRDWKPTAEELAD